MKGTNPTKAQKSYWGAVAQNGCVACKKDGHYNNHVSIHHILGRTKPYAHWLVLALCAGHHQDGTGNDASMVAVHPYKRRFEDAYGVQFGLYQQANRDLVESGLSFEENGWKEVELVNGLYEVIE